MDSSIVVFKCVWRKWNLLKRSVLFLYREYTRKALFFLKRQFFDTLIYLWWISVITGNDFMRNIIICYILKGLSKQLQLFVYADICKTIVPRTLSYCLFNLVNISPLIMLDFPFIRKGIMDFKTEFCKHYVVMTVWVKRRMKTPDSITKCGWFVKIRSVHDDELPIMCVGFLIICSNQNWEVTPSILEPSYVVMSLLYQRLAKSDS